MGLGLKLGQLFTRFSPLPNPSDASDAPAYTSHVLDPHVKDTQLPAHSASNVCTIRPTAKIATVSRKIKSPPHTLSLDGHRYGSHLSPSTTSLSCVHASAKISGQHDAGYIHHYLASLGPISSRLSRSRVDQHFLRWLPYLDYYAAEVLRIQGRGDIIEHTCGRCSDRLIDGVGLRCEDCFDTRLYCTKCCVTLHSRLPLHRIQHWTGDHFQPIRLKALGLHCQLGHADGQRCAFATHAESFVVLDVTGIHEVSIYFCGCQGAAEHSIQLLRQRWWPATFRMARTAATFQLLDHFDALFGQFSLESAVSSCDYYKHLVHLTDSVGANPPPDRFLSFEVMVKQWRHIKALQHCGTWHGTDPTCITRSSVDCPACRQDLGENVSAKPSDTSWLERLRCTVNVSNCCKLPHKGYRDKVPTDEHHDERHRDDQQQNKGFCVRVMTCPHGLKRANIVKNATYSRIRVDSLQNAPLATHDHNPVHDRNSDCNTQCQWVFTTAIDAKTRYEELEGRFRTWNMCQAIALPVNLLQRAKDILPQHHYSSQMYKALNECIPAAFTEDWSKMVAQWDTALGKMSNPYTVKHSHLSEVEVRQELAQQDRFAVEEGRVQTSRFTINRIVTMGLDLEEEQRRLRVDVAALSPSPPDAKAAELCERQDTLRRRIRAWHDAEQRLIPALASLRSDAADDVLPPQTARLLLPSAIHSSTAFSPDFLTCEWRLREAQAYDALSGLRGYLEVIAYVLECNTAHNEADDPDAKGRNNIIVEFSRMEINKLVVRYRSAYAALLELADPLGPVDWQSSLKELADSDVRFIYEGDADGQRSWIWRFGGTMYLKPEVLHDISKNKNLRDALRALWCNYHARTLASFTECDFLLAEMDRMTAFHSDQGKMWEGRINTSFLEYPQYLEGANAYAYQQASNCRVMEVHCRSLANVMRYWFAGDQIPFGSTPSFHLPPGSLVSLALSGGSSEAVGVGHGVGDDV